MKKITYKDIGCLADSKCFCCSTGKAPIILFTTTKEGKAVASGTYCIACLKKERYGLVGIRAEAFDAAIREFSST